VQTSFGIVLLALADRAPLTNVLEVFQHDRATRGGMLNDTTGEDMIAIPVESQSLASQLFQVTFRAFCSFELQLSLEAETATIHFFPVPTSQEVTAGSHGWTVEP
jgi:hypothetical protein